MPVSYLPQAPSRTRTFEIPLTLTPCQRKIDLSPSRFKIIRAGRKFGKSTYAEYSCIKKLGKPGAIVFFLGPTYRQAKLIAWEDFKRLIPREVLAKKPNETDLVLTLRNGSRLYVLGSDNADSLRGLAPDHVALEEFAMQTPATWYEIIRPNLMPRQGTADFISTPRGFNWMKDLEDDALRLKHSGSAEWDVFHFTVYDNPHNNVDEIEKAKKGCDGNEQVWRQEYMAEYESSVGRVFSSFSDERHCKPVSVPTARTEVYRAVDYGMRDDLACLWGYVAGSDRGPVLKIYREHLQSDTPASIQAQLIQNKTTQAENVQMNAISHDAAKQDAEMKGLTVKWHFENAGMRPMYLSSREKKASRHMIQTLIQEDRLVIDRNSCPKLVKQLLAYEWKDTLMEKTNDGNDDAVDALHYLVELLQFKLFLGERHSTEQTYKQKYDEYQREKAALAKPKWSIEKREALSEFQFENSAAGYF